MRDRVNDEQKLSSIPMAACRSHSALWPYNRPEANSLTKTAVIRSNSLDFTHAYLTVINDLTHGTKDFNSV
jgi:hypothetical protein